MSAAVTTALWVVILVICLVVCLPLIVCCACFAICFKVASTTIDNELGATHDQPHPEQNYANPDPFTRLEDSPKDTRYVKIRRKQPEYDDDLY